MDELSEAQIREIRAALTWGDQFTARRVADNAEDGQEVAARAMHRAAVRLEFIAPGTTLDAFLDLLPVDAMTAALEASRDPTSPPTAT